MDNELYEAAREGNIDFLNEAQTLKFEKGDEITQESYFVSRTADSGDNILHIAGSHGHVAFINKALEKLPALVLLICQKNSYGNNPLHVSAKFGQLELVKVLVESYKSYLQDIEGAKSRSMLLTLMIAEEGVAADPWSAQNSSGETPLHEALKNEHQDVALYLLEADPDLANFINDRDESVLYVAAAYGQEKVLRDAEGLTPLLKAATTGRMQAVQIILLHCPQSITICDTKGGSILHIITLKSKQDGDELVKLRAVNRLTNEPDHEGNTPLHQAVLDCNLIMVDLLLGNHNTDLMARNKEGLTAWESIKSQPEVSDSMAEIGYKLLMHERGSQPHTYLEQDNQLHRRQVDPRERWHRSFSTISIIAVVLAAISFVGMLLLPGKTDNQGNAILANKPLFKVFVLSNTLAICGYITVLLSTLFGMMINQRDDEPRILLSFSTAILKLSVPATAVAYATGIYAMISAKSLWLAIVAVSLPACIVICTVRLSIVLHLARLLSRIHIC